MSQRQAPRPPPARSDGIILALTPGSRTAPEARRLAARIVRKHLPGSWKVRELGSRITPDPRFELLRSRAKVQPTLRQALRWARRLERDLDVDRAEAVPVQPGIEPPEESGMLPPSGVITPKHKRCAQSADWSVRLVSAPQAWRLASKPGGRRRGGGIVVAHPDTGYTEHPELVAGERVLAERGFDFEDERANPRDPLSGRFAGHGTATASVIMSAEGSQTGDASRFVTGIAPEARLIPYRVSSSVVHLSFRKLTRAVYAAIDARAHVISMSLGGPVGQEYLREAVSEATQEGILVLAAAGNYYPFVVFPAAFAHVVAVAAINCRRKPWLFSASGRSVDLSAPGESVWRARSRPNQPFDASQGSGTSFAVATVAGAAALWLAHHGRNNLVRRYGKARLAPLFAWTVNNHGVDRPRGWNRSKYGAGILNTHKLLKRRLPTPSKLSRIEQAVHDRMVAPPRRGPDTRAAFGSLSHYFPDLTAEGLQRALRGVFRCRDDTLLRILEDHGPELRYYLATNEALRAWVRLHVRGRPTPTSTSRIGGVLDNFTTELRLLLSATVRPSATRRK